MSISRRSLIGVLLTAVVSLACISQGLGWPAPSVSLGAQAPTGGQLETIEGFKAQALGNTRNLYVYLPPGYDARGGRRYPVLYVQDGKAAFYPSEWSGQSLKLHEKADRLILEGLIDPLIIVGISNGGLERASEYTHWDGADRGLPVKGRGAQYETFLLQEVMPFIEARYPVEQGPEHTALMGASLGGLSCFVIAANHPERFSKAAVQSPNVWWGGEKLLKQLQTGALKVPKGLRLWMEVGTAENDLIYPVRRLVAELTARGVVPEQDMAYYEVPGGTHSEISWARQGDDALIWLFGSPGRPVDLELAAQKPVSFTQALSQPDIQLNPVMVFETGLRMTSLRGCYAGDNGDVATVGRSGRVRPVGPGFFSVIYISDTGLADTAVIEVTP